MVLNFLLISLFSIFLINNNGTLILNTNILNNGFENEILIDLAKIEKEIYVKIIELNRTITFNNTKKIKLNLMDDEIINFNELNLIVYLNKEEYKLKIPIKNVICKIFYTERIGADIFIYYSLDPFLPHNFIVHVDNIENIFTIKEGREKIILKNIPINSTITCIFKILKEESIYIEPKNFTINEEILIYIERGNSNFNINIFNKTPNLYLKNIPILINTSKEKISKIIEYLPPNSKYSFSIKNSMSGDLKISFLLKEDLRRLNWGKNSFSNYEEKVEENKESNSNLKFFIFILFLSFIIIFFAFRNREIEERKLDKRFSKKF
ncbi:MAG: hypothetical protein QXY18_06560 [Nitrososphaerota archaeon]